MLREVLHLGGLGPERRRSEARYIETHSGAVREWDPAPRPGPYIALHQETAGSGRFYIMASEVPAFIEQLRSLVPVVDQLATIKTGDAQ